MSLYLPTLSSKSCAKVKGLTNYYNRIFNTKMLFNMNFDSNCCKKYSHEFKINFFVAMSLVNSSFFSVSPEHLL